ncbi:MAG: hypothetical protein ACYCPP_05615 [Nitrososphaerales archaeon]
MKLTSSDAAEIQKLSSSTSFLKLADSILQNMDRDTLAEFLAGYLYFKSNEGSNSDFAFFLATKKFPKIAMISMNVLAVVLPGLLLDKAFRSVILGAAAKSSKKSERELNL